MGTFWNKNYYSLSLSKLLLYKEAGWNNTEPFHYFMIIFFIYFYGFRMSYVVNIIHLWSSYNVAPDLHLLTWLKLQLAVDYFHFWLICLFVCFFSIKLLGVNVFYNFPNSRMASSNWILSPTSGPKLNDIKSKMSLNREQQRILTTERLITANVWHFFATTDYQFIDWTVLALC